MRQARTALRLARVALHLGWGAATVAVVFPLIHPTRRATLQARWSSQLLRMLGVRLELRGALPGPRALVVANHISWLDVFVVNARLPGRFVCKAEVRAWPLIGWLCERTDTLFLERASARAARVAGARVGDALRRAERPVVVFPEGTSSDGRRVLPFHGALFEAAIATSTPVVALALRYADRHGAPCDAPGYHGDVGLATSLLRIASASGLRAQAEFVAQLSPEGADRRLLARRAHAAIVAGIERAPRARQTPVGSPLGDAAPLALASDS